MPGTDHAGIATQNVVEKQLADGRARRASTSAATRSSSAPSAFVDETGGDDPRAAPRDRRVGDWSRTAYTLSPELSRAVREAFVRLYERGLIYRGHRVIHWCPRCLTSLSDEEAEHNERRASSITSRIRSTDDPTRAHHRRDDAPRDDARRRRRRRASRRRALSRPHRQARACCRSSNVEIPIIADDYADPDVRHRRGEDHAGARRERLRGRHAAQAADAGRDRRARHDGEGADADGRVPAELRGLDRFEARERIVADARGSSGALVKIEPHQHAVRHCYRCDTVVEPRLSDQWFVKMEPLAEPALAGRARRHASAFCPSGGRRCTCNWLENIRDWNISRQLWWGHRIPVWYCDACGRRASSSRDDVATCPTVRRPGAPGRGRARHLVLVVALAVLDARLAERERRRPARRSIRPTCSSPRRRSSSSGSRG